MSDRRSYKQSVVTQKRPSSTSKVERLKAEVRPQAKSASALIKTHTDNFLAKEEKYKLLNAELEAKTEDLVKQAEQLVREQNEVLSKPISTFLLTEPEDEDDSRIKKPHQCTLKDPSVKAVTKNAVKSTPQNTYAGLQMNDSHLKTLSSTVSQGDKLAAEEDSADVFLAKAIRSIEERINQASPENVLEDHEESYNGDNVGLGISDAEMRALKAKLRIMQEELDQLSCEYYKKDVENAKLSAKTKELEENRDRLQKTTNIQQTQIEKHRASVEESAKKCDTLQLQVSGLKKEIELLNRSNKQAVATHGTVEVRLSRALEEVEKLKTQLNKMKQTNNDKISEEHQSKENLLAENRMLKKQKGELIVGFKKQLKLIDILKRQKMHFEAAKLLSFTEEEFMKALDWGKS